MTNHPLLTKTPVREIIFTISYSETITLDELKLFSQQKDIAEKYNTIRDGFNTQLVASEGQKPVASIASDGYILKCDDDNQVVQARIGSFSFHKMVYEDFEKLVSELMRLWDLLLMNTKEKLSINNISLRYLNFIEFDGKENIDDLITIKPSNPFSEKLDSCFMQLKFNDKTHSDVEINVITATPVSRQAKTGLLLDIILNQKQLNTIDYDAIKSDFIAMRVIKNDIFFKSITGYAVNKYQ